MKKVLASAEIQLLGSPCCYFSIYYAITVPISKVKRPLLTLFLREGVCPRLQSPQELQNLDSIQQYINL